MNLDINEKFKKVQISKDIGDIYAYEIKNNEVFLNTYKLIFKNTYAPKNLEGKGISKSEIRNQLNITRTACDEVIRFFEGSTLVYFNQDHKEKLYQLTIRGFQVLELMIKNQNIDVDIKKKIATLTKDMCKMYAYLIKRDDDIFNTYKLVFKNTNTPKNTEVSGISKSEIRSKMNFSRTNCDEIIRFLEGAMLIQFKQVHKEKLFQISHRGFQVLDEIIKSNKK